MEAYYFYPFRLALSIVAALTLLLSGCRDEKPAVHTPLGRLAPSVQRFEIPARRDTVLRCASGTRLHIAARTFDTPAATIVLEVREALRREEMIAAGLSTRSTDGRALESAGMLYLGAVEPANLAIHHNFPIEVHFPAKGLRSELQVFTAIDGADGRIDWQSPRPVENDFLVKQIAGGKALFCKHCTPCHSPQLHEDIIGPALGNVQLFRSMEWLLPYTLQAATLLAENDSLAVCIDARWPTAKMNDLPKLTEEDVQSIYRFIAEESVVQEIPAKPQGFPCAAPLAARFDGVPPTFARQEEQSYVFKTYQFGWLNCDVFTDEAAEVPFAVMITDEEGLDSVSVFLVFERRNIAIPLLAFGSIFSVQANGRAVLPLEPVRILAWGYRNGQFFKGMVRTTLRDSNLIRLQLQPAPELGPEQAFARDMRFAAPAGSGCDWGWNDLMKSQ